MGKPNNNNNNINNNNNNNNNNNKKWGLSLPSSYLLSIMIRFIIGVLAIGYIHPDEYFQSPEITSSFMFNYKTFKPWEFNDDNPCRSVVIPLFNSGVPFYILKQIQKLIYFTMGEQQGFSIINGNTLIMVPRLFMVSLSFLLDYYIVLICKNFNLSYRKSLSILSSCWLIIIFHSRTFSNTIESLLVATLITLVLLYKKTDDNGSSSTFMKDLLIGGVVSCGIFSRFTFIFFAAPLGIYLFYLFYSDKSKSILSCFFSIILISAGFIITSSIFIIIDSIYFKYLDFNQILPIIQSNIEAISISPIEIFNQISSLDIDSTDQIFSFLKNNLTYTPINSFIYNLDIKNLSDHGIHNRLTHSFINLPMMVGPLVLLLVFEIFNIKKNNANSSNKESLEISSGNSGVIKKNQHHGNQHKKEIFPKSIRILLILIVAFGLFFLSLAPHQEPRFLLPLFFPLVLLTYRYFYFNKKSSKLLLILWILFNMSLTIFFGFIHQGGVTSSLTYINSNIVSKQQQLNKSNSSGNIKIIYYHTYMPPRYLLGIDNKNDKINLIDVGGKEIGDLVNLIEKSVNSKIYVLSPSKTILYQQHLKHNCQLINSFWPHLTTEDPPASVDESRLFMFECVDL